MPITAFSKATGDELDVGQLLRRLAQRDGVNDAGAALEDIPETWRTEIRTDMECPSCFILGAELVREGVSKGANRKIVRQACFRYSEHLPQCDFARPDAGANFIPENLVAFGSEKSGMTIAVRQLVGAGIQMGAFSQRSIRDMRKWFFSEKVANSFVVTLDPALPLRLRALFENVGGLYGEPQLTVTREMAALPGFDWRDAARRELRLRHSQLLEAVANAKVPFWRCAKRIASLARRYQGDTVFDPSPLRNEYVKTTDLSWFISRNYAPIRRFAKNNRWEEPAPCVLAFTALLLFVSNWDLNSAAALFARIALSAPNANCDLGNVIGLNPWHDFDAWSALKALQLLDVQVSADAPMPTDELSEIEASLRRSFGSEW